MGLLFGLPAHAQTPTKGLVGHWTLNDADGSKSAVDSSGHDNPAKCGPVMSLGSGTTETVNCPTFGVPGKHGTAAYFPDIATFLVVNNTIANSFTIAAWLKTTEAGQGAAGGQAYEGTGVIWSDIAGPAADMIPMALLGGHISFGTGDCKSDAYDSLTSSVAVNTGKWVFVAVTRDAATGEKRIYIDGKLDGQHKNTGTCALNANKIVTFGGNPLDDRYFKGALDDIRFYNRALSADDIVTLMTSSAVALKTAQASTNQSATVPAPVVAVAAQTPASATTASADSFAGKWAADMKTVPAQDPPLKSQALTVTRTADGYTTEQTAVQQTKGGGTSNIFFSGRIVLDGKPHKGAMGETRTCTLVNEKTIHCAVAMGPHGFDETYALSGGGQTFTDTMSGKGPDGKVHSMATVYRKTAFAATAPPLATGPQRIVTHNGECEATVPKNWTVSRHYSQASSPDGRIDVHVFTTSYADNMKTLAELKALNVNAYKPVKTFEDTPQRIWWQYAPHFENNNGWFVAVLGKTGTCNLEISFANSVIADEAVAKTIARSLKPAR